MGAAGGVGGGGGGGDGAAVAVARTPMYYLITGPPAGSTHNFLKP